MLHEREGGERVVALHATDGADAGADDVGGDATTSAAALETHERGAAARPLLLIEVEVDMVRGRIAFGLEGGPLVAG